MRPAIPAAQERRIGCRVVISRRAAQVEQDFELPLCRDLRKGDCFAQGLDGWHSLATGEVYNSANARGVLPRVVFRLEQQPPARPLGFIMRTRLAVLGCALAMS